MPVGRCRWWRCASGASVADGVGGAADHCMKIEKM